jgi:ketosteroid isomerase-like protein
MIRRFLISAILISAAAFAADLRTEVQAAENTWIAAIKAHDAAALDRVLSDDLIYVHSGGVVDSKAQYIAKVTSGKQVYKSVDQFKMKIRVDGALAAAQYWARMQGINATGNFDDNLVVSHTWVKTATGWRLAYHQTTRVPEIPK